jgi:hypothetical protein
LALIASLCAPDGMIDMVTNRLLIRGRFDHIRYRSGSAHPQHQQHNGENKGATTRAHQNQKRIHFGSSSSYGGSGLGEGETLGEALIETLGDAGKEILIN